MKVKDLIKVLDMMNKDSEVLIVTQPAWPFENRLAGICCREDYLGGVDPSDDGVSMDERTKEGLTTDVLLCQGAPVRYGNAEAWECF